MGNLKFKKFIRAFLICISMALLHIIIAVVCFSGLLIGMILAFSNRDELKPAKKYLIMAQKIILVSILVATMIFYKLPIIVLMFVFIISLFPFLQKQAVKTPPIYLLLGVVFLFSLKSTNLFALNASLIFLFGLPSGTLIKIDKKGNIRKGFAKELAKNLGFFAPLFFL